MTPKRAYRARRETGAIGVEFVLVAPAVVLAFMLLLQYAVKATAERAAQAAAEEGAAVARSYNGSAAEGESMAAMYADRVGDGVLHNVDVDATRTGDTASVTVSGQATSLLGFTIDVEQTSTGPVERFVPEAGEAQ